MEFWITNKIREVREKGDNIKHKMGLLTGHDEMKLSEPRDTYTFLASLAGGWNVITSKKALDQHKGDLKQVDNFPGTGPFMYKSRTTESWEMVRNPNYWNPYAPYVDRIVQF
jgi:ABC-type transport system substrate-binding protein